MTNYIKTTDFAAKDSLPSGNAAKIVKGTEIDAEFNNIAIASATKADKNNSTLTGTTVFETLSDGTIAITGWVDEDNMASNSAVLIPTQQSVKAYVDSNVTAQDLDVTDGTTSIDIDLDSESLGILGGTGITSTASGTGVTLAIDSTVATLTGTQTLSNKTLTTPVISGALTTNSTIDGRDVAVDGTKLDGIESGATTDQTAAEIKTAYESNANTNAFTDADESKLDGIEALADVTDTANVTAAGALMDSELTNITAVKALNQGVATTDSPTFATVNAPLTGNVTGNLTGSVLTAAQPNITSVGTLSTLAVTGALTVDTDTLVVDATNNRVGIGTSSPNQLLEVADSSGGATVNISTDQAAGSIGSKKYMNLDFSGYANTVMARIQSWDESSSTGNGYLTFHTTPSGGSVTERMRLNSAGLVGINNPNPAQILSICNPANPNRNGMEIAIGAGDTSSNTIQNYNRATGAYTPLNIAGSILTFGVGASAQEALRIDASRNVMVGTTTQYFARFSVQGETFQNAVTVRVGTNGYPAINFQNTAGAQQGYITTNASSVQYVSVSDERAKENIADADDAGSKIDSIQVRKFDWIVDGSHQDYGMIAQELQAVAPEAVSGDADSENMMGVDYSKLVPMLVKEIQSLRTRVQELENN